MLGQTVNPINCGRCGSALTDVDYDHQGPAGQQVPEPVRGHGGPAPSGKLIVATGSTREFDEATHVARALEGLAQAMVTLRARWVTQPPLGLAVMPARVHDLGVQIDEYQHIEAT